MALIKTHKCPFPLRGELTSVAIWLMMWQSVIRSAAAGPKTVPKKTEAEQTIPLKGNNSLLIDNPFKKMTDLFFLSILV